MRLIATFITAYLALTLSVTDKSNAAFNNCSAQLEVEKNRSSKSADEEGAQFVLELTNTSLRPKTFQISVKNLSGPCKKGNTKYNRGNSTMNVELDLGIQNMNMQSNVLQRPNPEDSTYAEIQLNGGESFKFIVDVQVPKGTPFNIWNCVQVEARSTDCTTSPETETLSVFIVDPREG